MRDRATLGLARRRRVLGAAVLAVGLAVASCAASSDDLPPSETPVASSSPAEAVCPPTRATDLDPVRRSREGDLVPPLPREALLCIYPWPDDPSGVAALGRSVVLTGDVERASAFLNALPERRDDSIVLYPCLALASDQYVVVLGYADREPVVVNFICTRVEQGGAVRQLRSLRALLELWGL